MMKRMIADADELQSSPSGGVRQPDRRVPVHVDICKQGRRANGDDGAAE